MIWYHTKHEQTVLLHHYSQWSGITQGSARADSLASPLQPMIWYHTSVSTSRQSCFTITANDLVSHTRISRSRQSCFTIIANDLVSHKGQPEQTVLFPITANDLVSHKGQHKQTVLFHHNSQWFGITQESARADSFASPLQPMIRYHTIVSTSRQSCFTITSNDLVSHKGQPEQTVLLHHYSQRSGITHGSEWADSLASPLLPMIWYYTRVSTSRLSCFTITGNDLVSYKGQHEHTVWLHYYRNNQASHKVPQERADSRASPLQPLIWYHTRVSTSTQSCFTITANDLVTHKGQHEQRALLSHYSQRSVITQWSAWSDSFASSLQPKIWYHTRASPSRLSCFLITANDLVPHKGQHKQTAFLHHYSQWSGITLVSARADSLPSPLQMIWYHRRVRTSRESCFTITANDLVSHKGQQEQTVLLHHYSQWSGIRQGTARADSLASPLQPMIWYHRKVRTSRESCFSIITNDLVPHKGQYEQTALLHHYSQWSGITQGSARADSLSSPLQPMIWYHTRVSTSRQSCFTITGNDLVSYKGQHEQTVLLPHYSQRSGITQGSARADSLASHLQPIICYHTRVSTSRQPCFPITANDLVSHKGQHEQTVLLHNYSQWSGITQGSARACRQSCFPITTIDLVSH